MYMYMYVCELKSQWVNCDVVEQGPNTVDGEYYGKLVVFSVLEVVPNSLSQFVIGIDNVSTFD